MLLTHLKSLSLNFLRISKFFEWANICDKFEEILNHSLVARSTPQSLWKASEKTKLKNQSGCISLKCFIFTH
ncbi:unnamed protein product [Blepharisma stoltei]|uniref:Uncharacterized protein n=1 Tax=Blepharisma stoltei TaxID=1481888 RepID=A0AAU9IN00_9CILI|nr:unnamed protein product [Blepharisma stoltei]